MAKVQYTGSADERIIDAEDFQRLGMPHDRVVWEKESLYTAEMSDDVAQSLVELMPDEFKVLDRDDDAPVQPEESPANPEGSGKSATDDQAGGVNPTA